jgi:tetratricopeptide (TPR) repeat protein
MKQYKLTLCMIVKNEESIIEKTIKNIINNIPIDYWVISDTGSSDNTINIIQNTFNEHNIQGEFINKNWVDFSTNRNYVIEHAEQKSEYLLYFDADDSIEGNIILPNLKDDSYLFQLKNKQITYNRIFITSTKFKWRYKCILHEFITCLNKNNPNSTLISGNYYIYPNKLKSNRNINSEKYLNDALVFEKAIKENNIPEGCEGRYNFYTAQSYRDAKQLDKAIIYYKKVISGNNWVEEKYNACLFLGNYYSVGISRNLSKSINYFSKGIEFVPNRTECILSISKILEKEPYNLNNKLVFNILTSLDSDDICDYIKNKHLFLSIETQYVYFINSIIILGTKLHKFNIIYKYLCKQINNNYILDNNNLSCCLNNSIFFLKLNDIFFSMENKKKLFNCLNNAKPNFENRLINSNNKIILDKIEVISELFI